MESQNLEKKSLKILKLDQKGNLKTIDDTLKILNCNKKSYEIPKTYNPSCFIIYRFYYND